MKYSDKLRRTVLGEQSSWRTFDVVTRYFYQKVYTPFSTDISTYIDSLFLNIQNKEKNQFAAHLHRLLLFKMKWMD